MRIVRRLLLAAAAVLVLFVLTFAVPVRLWRTGEQLRAPLIADRAASVEAPSRIWIDTDAACGHGPRTDPDDCLALLLLADTSGLDIAGISTVFGNAPLDVTDRTTRELVTALETAGHDLPDVFTGAGSPQSEDGSKRRTDATRALEAALAEGPLAIVALGPLTNIAATLARRPELVPRVTSLVAVMGRRTGHLFHPSEGAGAGTLLGHGPIFSDFNHSMDTRAATQILGLRVPLVLVPYVASRDVEIAGTHLDRLADRGGPHAWVAARCREWLAYWREEIGREGFYPFDLVAAAYVRDPRQLLCARVTAWVGDDPTMFIPFWNPPALLVTQDRDAIVEAEATGQARYCFSATVQFERALSQWLGGAPS